jgi:hypothetical protein
MVSPAKAILAPQCSIKAIFLDRRLPCNCFSRPIAFRTLSKLS